MKNAEYAILAALIGFTVIDAQTRNDEPPDMVQGRVKACERIAFNFAENIPEADRLEFLKACKVDPDKIRPPGKLFSPAEAAAIARSAATIKEVKP